MSVTYQIRDDYCPEGHGSWLFVPSSTLYSDYYWCKECNLFYVPTVKAKTAEEVNKEFFGTNRAQELKEYAEFLAARKRVTKEQLKQLGLMN